MEENPKVNESDLKEDFEDSIIAECEIKGRNFVITTDKRIFEKDKEGNYKEYLEEDPETAFLKKYVKPPKSLDIER